MKKYLAALAVLIIGGLILGLAGNFSDESDADKTELTVAAAASLTVMLAEITLLFEEENPEIKLTVTFGGSGALMTQIEEGAPVDVFISAAQKQMNMLEEKDLLQPDSRRNVLLNKVVLITPRSSDKGIAKFEDLATEKTDKIALGDPSSVPAGQYAEEILTNLDIMEQVNEKVVLATDVRQVLSWVETGEVDCGIVYATDAQTSDLVNITAQAPADSYQPVVYPAALIRGTTKTEAGWEFLEFLSGEEVEAVFKKYGFVQYNPDKGKARG